MNHPSQSLSSCESSFSHPAYPFIRVLVAMVEFLQLWYLLLQSSFGCSMPQSSHSTADYSKAIEAWYSEPDCKSVHHCLVAVGGKNMACS